MKRSRVIIAISTVVAIAAIATFAVRKREPVYQGKRLSQWLVEANTGSWPRPSRVPADEAIREIGTNAFPMIVQLLHSRDSIAKSTLIKLSYRSPLIARMLIRLHVKTQVDDHTQAIAACYALGPVAKPLVPEVAKALQHMKNQPFAEQWLGGLGPDAEAAIPALVEILKDKKNLTRCMAAQNLARISFLRPDDALPVLHECLQDTNFVVHFEARRALDILEHEARVRAAAQ